MDITPKEREILILVAQGMSSREIALQMSASTRAIGYAIEKATADLGARSRIDGIVKALASGCIPFPNYAPMLFDKAGWARADPISPREREVLTLVGQGMVSAEIGHLLGCSTKTVDTHVDHVMVRLGARNRLNAVVRALKHGYITFPKMGSATDAPHGVNTA